MRTIRAELDVTLRELDQVSRRAQATTVAMTADDIDAATLTVLARRLSQDEASMKTLTAERERLESSLRTAIGKSAALHDSESFLALVRSAETGGLRLRLRTEIQRRVAKISILFGGEDYPTRFIQIQYSNGMKHLATLQENGSLQLVRHTDFLAAHEAIGASYRSQS